MGLVKAVQHQIGLSSTISQNFVITAEDEDGTLKIQRGTVGSYSSTPLTIDANNYLVGDVTPPADDSSKKLATTEFVIGRLINQQIFTASGTYTPTPGTRKVVVEVQGGGGSGGGAAVTTASNLSTGGGGNSGAYAKSILDVPASPVAITVGSGGTPVTGNSGNAGGNSSYGSTVTAAGGNAGVTLSEGTSGGVAAVVGGYPSPDYTGANVFGSGGGYGQVGLRVNGTFGHSGSGGTAVLGSGGGPRGSAGVGSGARGYGGGGAGAMAAAAGQNFAGGAGSPGVVIIWEFA